MKVAMVTAFPESPDRIPSGLAGVSVTLAGALSAIPGLELSIIVPGSHAREGCVREFAGVKVHYLPRRGPASPAVRYLWTSPRAITRKLAGIEHDLVHVQNWANFLPRSGKPTVLTIHGILERDILYRGRFRWLRSQVMRRIETRALERASDVIVVSPYVQEAMGSRIRGRTWNIDNPVADRFFDVERRPIPGRVLFAGRLTRLKNVTGLIAAFARYTRGDSDAVLRVAGGDDGTGHSGECERTAADLGIAEKVAFLGALSAGQMQEEFAQASCLALCSFQENAPLVIGEAMAAGIPVVASNVGGISSMVEDGGTGLLVDPRDPEGIARALADVMDPGRGEQMSSRARLIARERFRASAVARKTCDVYREILGERNADPGRADRPTQQADAK
jgi:glycosyltransferase involved in cell wall biosynthesis